MPRPRFQKLEPDKQARILDAAGAEFARHGYRAASLNAIIEAAGISKGAFYYYFDDKADLFSTVLMRARDEIFEGADFDFSHLERDTYWSSVGEISRRSFAYSQAHPWIVELSRTLHEKPDDFGEPLRRFLDDAQDVLRRYLRRGQALGLVRDDVPFDLLVELISALDRVIDGWMARRWQDFGMPELERVSECILDMVRRMLEPPSPAGDHGRDEP